MREGGSLFVKSEISLYGGERLTGTITAAKDSISFTSLSDPKAAPRVERVADIAEISFLDWQGEKKAGRRVLFHSIACQTAHEGRESIPQRLPAGIRQIQLCHGGEKLLEIRLLLRIQQEREVG